MRNLQLPGRSAVMATNGMACTSHPLATNAALKVLQDGGNAVDAAIAASALLCVVEPAMTGIGGDCFAIIHEPDGEIYGINGSGKSASNCSLDWYRDQKISDLDELPVHTVTVPGALSAWNKMVERFGTRSLEYLFQWAVQYGENGFPVAPRVAHDWKIQTPKLARHEGAQKNLLINGAPPAAGDFFRSSALAQSFQEIGKFGIDHFYKGPIAKDIVDTVQQLGGFLSMDDLAGMEAEWVDLIHTDYRGYKVFEIPPNGQGITALILLNILEQLASHKLDPQSSEYAHLLVESARMAYSVRDHHVSDPDTMQIEIEELLSTGFAEQLSRQFSADKRNPDIQLPEARQTDTTYLTVIDKDMRAVSFINSLYAGFGSGIVTERSGIALQNRGACFSLVEGHPNAIGPSKRPMHTIIPAMVTKDDQLFSSFGVMGGAYQPMGHAHVLTNVIDHGMDPQEAIDQGRIFWGEDGTVHVEDGIEDHIADDLRKLGHQVANAPAPLGGGQMICVDHKNGVFTGGSDPRKDGMALGY